MTIFIKTFDICLNAQGGLKKENKKIIENMWNNGGITGVDPEILKRGGGEGEGGEGEGALYVGHHGWPAKKILGFR